MNEENEALVKKRVACEGALTIKLIAAVTLTEGMKKKGGLAGAAWQALPHVQTNR